MELDAKTEEDVRLSFSIPKSLHIRLNHAVPWGVKSEFIRRCIEHALNRIEQADAGDSSAIIGGIIKGVLDPFAK